MTNSERLPASVSSRASCRAEWASEHGLSDLAESDFDRHLDSVFERLGVNDECSDLNGPHQRMREGCERLGYDFRLITRNADRGLYTPESAAFMGFGDASGSKRSTAKTYLVDAQAAGAEDPAACEGRTMSDARPGAAPPLSSCASSR